MISCCSRVLSLLKCSTTLFASLPGREEAYVSSTPRDTMPILSRVVFFTIYIISSA